ncbi:hypothetical protein [Caballeronia novacaledonica]|uniref:hypothetical protein n=1 Tax=Caballeronia novacaledonica TaxID=1544861 RepID=UPI0015E684B7|nr:hypothetical protein [Caballeronia novacaledonica]
MSVLQRQRSNQTMRRKKTARLAGGFFGNSVCSTCVRLTLSIRQRLEMPKKIKIKLGGHVGSKARQKSCDCFYNLKRTALTTLHLRKRGQSAPDDAARPQTNASDAEKPHKNHTVPPTVIFSMRNVG